MKEIVHESWTALARSRVRSVLTMLGIVWGIVAVTLLIAYGSSFRAILVHAFEAFGKSAVVCWPEQTSEQPGGQRAGKVVRFEQADLDLVRSNATLVKHSPHARHHLRRPSGEHGHSRGLPRIR
jgi:putative ABC transport system permease protein